MAPNPKIQTENVLDVFQPGLRRGAAKLPFAPHKRYFYVEHPVEGWRVYLRAVCFIHELYRPFNAKRFLVVKRTSGDPEKATWEPPKGQMEGKDGEGRKPVFKLLRDSVRREVEEEAKIGYVRELTHTGLVLQSVEPDFPENTFFQYHVFAGYAHPKQLEGAFNEFEWIRTHPEEFAKQKSDQREKDALDWYDQGTKKIMGRWSPTLVQLYTKRFSQA